MNKIITFIIAALLTTSVFAQKQGDQDQIVSTKIAFFTTEIGLTPEEAQVFWPVYNKYWDEIQKAHKCTKDNLMNIKAHDEKKDFSESQMKSLVKKYISSYINESKLQEKYFEEFSKILSTEKVAKLYIAEDNFRIKLTKMWREQHRNAPKDNGQTPPPPAKEK